MTYKACFYHGKYSDLTIKVTLLNFIFFLFLFFFFDFFVLLFVIFAFFVIFTLSFLDHFFNALSNILINGFYVVTSSQNCIVQLVRVNFIPSCITYQLWLGRSIWMIRQHIMFVGNIREMWANWINQLQLSNNIFQNQVNSHMLSTASYLVVFSNSCEFEKSNSQNISIPHWFKSFFSLMYSSVNFVWKCFIHKFNVFILNIIGSS